MTLGAMQEWMKEQILPHFGGVEGTELRTRAAFEQARRDGVSTLKMSVGLGLAGLYGGSADRVVEMLKRLHVETAPEVRFIPEVGLDRATPADVQLELLEPFLAAGYFKAIDLCGDESARPVREFRPLYRRAKEAGLLLSAHVGEFGSPDSVREAVEELELSQVQHGIAAARSKPVMKWLADNRIQLNVCPTSNVRLCRATDYGEHPIRELYYHGVRVTVNTDDVLVFGQGVSEEFFHLYRSGLLQAFELNEIREYGLEAVHN